MRVFAIQKKSAIFRFLTGCITFVVLWALAFFFATLFECGHNFELIWGSQREFKMWCSDTSLLVRILCFIDFITDLVIILIPVPLVRGRVSYIEVDAKTRIGSKIKAIHRQEDWCLFTVLPRRRVRYNLGRVKQDQANMYQNCRRIFIAPYNDGGEFHSYFR